MFLEIIKDYRTGTFQSHRLITAQQMIEQHPYCLDLRGWARGGRMNSRFGLSNPSGQYLYVKTEERDEGKLEQLARSF